MPPVSTIFSIGRHINGVSHLANAKGNWLSEDVNTDVQEVVQPSEPETVQDNSVSQEPQKGSSEYNFRETRKIIEQQSREINELRYHLGAMQQKPAPVEEDPSDSDYLTKKQWRELEEQREAQRRAQLEYDAAEDRMRLKNRDYDEVVTEQNIKELIEDDSDLSETLRNAPNPYATAYKLIKKSSFYQQKQVKPKKNMEAEKIVQNVSKPVSSNAVQARPLATANEFASSSSEERQALYREMMSYASRRN